jgi:hypothetical protein
VPSRYSQKGIHFMVPDGWTVSDDSLDEVLRAITLEAPPHVGSCMVDLYKAEQAPQLNKYIQNQIRHFAEALPFGFKIIEGPHNAVEKARHQGREVLGTTVRLVIRSLWFTRSREVSSFFRIELGSHTAMCSLRCDDDEVSYLRPGFEELLESLHAQTP